MARTHAVVDSPIGPLTAIREDGALVGLLFALDDRPVDPARLGPRDDRSCADVTGQLVP